MTLSVIRAFLIRDYLNEVSYRFSFLMSIGGVFFSVLVFYFLSEFIGPAAAPALAAYGGDYFSFVLIGIAFTSYFTVGLTGFAGALRQSQATGTLEAMLMTPTPLPVIVVGSAVWSYIFTTFRVFIYLLMGTLLLGASFAGANYLAALAGLILAIISFASIGIISAGIIMVIKRGEPLTMLIATIANLVGGVYYPVEILPGFLQWIAYLLPITYALRVMRRALLTGASWAELASDLGILLLFCLILFPLSLLVFHYAVRRARREGTLAHY